MSSPGCLGASPLFLPWGNWTTDWQRLLLPRTGRRAGGQAEAGGCTECLEVSGKLPAHSHCLGVDWPSAVPALPRAPRAAVLSLVPPRPHLAQPWSTLAGASMGPTPRVRQKDLSKVQTGLRPCLSETLMVPRCPPDEVRLVSTAGEAQLLPLLSGLPLGLHPSPSCSVMPLPRGPPSCGRFLPFSPCSALSAFLSLLTG